jgi:hypothetical protein
MNSTTRNLCCLLSTLIAPAFARASAIEVNGTCEVGDCTTGGLQSSALSFGQSTGPNTFDISNFTIGSDTYDLDITAYGASYLSGTFIFIDFSATYTGSGPSTSADTIRIDQLQDFFSDISGTWDSPPNYTENVPAIVASGTTFQANLCYNGGSSTQCVGQVGPVGGGTYNFGLSNGLMGLGSGDYLAADFDFILDFPAGTAPGTTIEVPASVPEPAFTGPVALVLVGLVCAILVRRGKLSLREET